MKVWILTGDKQETAINIGFSSRQLTNKMTLLIINGPTKEVSLLPLLPSPLLPHFPFSGEMELDNVPQVVKQLLEEHVRTYLTPIHGVTKQSNVSISICHTKGS